MPPTEPPTTEQIRQLRSNLSNAYNQLANSLMNWSETHGIASDHTLIYAAYTAAHEDINRLISTTKP